MIGQLTVWSRNCLTMQGYDSLGDDSASCGIRPDHTKGAN
jgi:hypothetical protein